MLAVVIAEGVAIAVLALLVLGLLRSHALILRALHELGAGLELEQAHADRPAQALDRAGAGRHRVRCRAGHPAGDACKRHAVSGTTLAGEEVAIPVAGRRPPDPAGLPVERLQRVPDLLGRSSSAGRRDVPGDGRLVVVAKDPHEESVTRLRELAGPRLDVVQSSAAWTDYAVPGSPYFVYVEDGVITGEGSSTTWRAGARPDAPGRAATPRRLAGAPARAGPGRTERRQTTSPTSHRVDRELLGAGIAARPPEPVRDPDDEAPHVTPSPTRPWRCRAAARRRGRAALDLVALR